MDATQGIFLREYDAVTLAPNVENAWNIATGGGVPSCIAIAYSQEQHSIYITGRGNKAFTLMGEPEITTDATKAWDVLMAKYLMPEMLSTSVNTVIVSQQESNQIYDHYGRCLGTSKDNLPSGIYIQAGKKFIIR